MAKRNVKHKSSLKKVTLERKALKQRVTSMRNEVASLQDERIINTSFKE